MGMVVGQKKQGEDRVFGHQNGVVAVKDTVEAAAEIGINYLTLYAFSTENWNRPQQEVDALMQLLISTIGKETAPLNKNNIRLQAIGDLKSLPGDCHAESMEAIASTAQNTRMTLVLALSYSSKWEITNAMKQIFTFLTVLLSSFSFAQSINISPFATGFSNPVDIAHPVNDSRLFVVQKNRIDSNSK